MDWLELTNEILTFEEEIQLLIIFELLMSDRISTMFSKEFGEHTQRGAIVLFSFPMWIVEFFSLDVWITCDLYEHDNESCTILYTYICSEKLHACGLTHILITASNDGKCP